MYFRKKKDSRGEWRWTLYAANHEAIAVSSEGYVYERDCDHGINLVKSTSTGTPVRDG